MNEKKDRLLSSVWNYFNQINKIPRPSKKETAIRNYLLLFAKENALLASTDEAGNVLIKKEASRGKETAAPIALQSHMDMVCEKNSNSKHNFDKDPIITWIEDDWMYAKDTTLGADNGLGMAIQLAILADKTLTHPKLECLFTCDEETGLYGAINLKNDWLQSNTLINLDSEEEGEFCIGCAGGQDTLAEIPLVWEDTPENFFFFKVKVSGLQGGHSGEDINKGRANAIKLMANYLQILSNKTDIRINQIDGGNLRNAIPRECEAILAVPYKDKELVRVEINHYVADVEALYNNTDNKIRFDLDSSDILKTVLSAKNTNTIITFLSTCPNGVISMSEQIPGLVETSTNLAAIHSLHDHVFIETSQRSAKENKKKALSLQIVQLAESLGGKTAIGKDYPGWEPNTKSAILQSCITSYRKLFNKEALVKAIHAGLECGVIGKKYPHLDMISIGPTIENPHSPSERVSLSSVEKCLILLVDVLENH